MDHLTFYRQARVDGGVRTGIDVNGQSLLEAFQSGGDQHDPALLWYVDVRFQGEHFPTNSDAVSDWLIQRSKTVRKGLNEAAEELAIGFDSELKPYERIISEPSDDAQIRVVVSAIRRIEGRDIAPELREISANWETILQQLAPLANV